MNLETATVVGSASETTWSQAATRTETEAAGVAVLLLTHKTESDLVDLPQVGGKLLESILETILQNATLPELKTALESTRRSVGEGIGVQYLAARVYDNKLTMTGTAGMVVYLLRGGTLAKLVDGENVETGLAGAMRPDDAVILATARMVEVCTLPTIRRALAEGVRGAETLGAEIHTQADSSQAAGILLAVPSKAPKHLTIPGPKRLFLRREVTNEERRRHILIGATVATILAILVAYGYVKRGQERRLAAYTDTVQTVQSAIAEAQNVAQSDPGQAREDLTKADQAIQTYLATKPGVQETAKAKVLAGEVQTASQAVFQIYPVTLSPLVPLSILSPTLSATRMAPDGKGNLLFAGEAGQIIGVSTKDKSKFSYDILTLGAIKAVTAGDTGIFALTDKGVAQILPKQTTGKLVLQPDELWGNVTMISTFAGNVYLFDGGNNEIWKYPVLDTGFGTRKRWLAAGITPDLSKIVDFRVTGDVWMLSSTGKVLRYTRGAPQKFPMTGLPDLHGDGLLVDPVALDATDTNVYVLERGAGRVDVFTTDGVYAKQYVADDFAKATDIAVADGKMYVLVAGGVEWFGL